MYFNCRKGEFDRFFDRPFEEFQPDRFSSLIQLTYSRCNFRSLGLEYKFLFESLKKRM